MQKLFPIFVPFLMLVIVVSGLYFFILKDKGKGALQITSTPKSAVYIDRKLIGQTPFCKCDVSDMLPSGEYAIRLVPLVSDEVTQEAGLSPFEQKIKINKSVLTVVDRTFGKGASSEGSIITLTPTNEKKSSQILLLSMPEKAETLLDSKSVGATPLFLQNITSSDHELQFKKDEYNQKTLRIKTVSGYKLEAIVFLGVSGETQVKATPLATPSATPTNTPSMVTILETPTGYLNVRSGNSVTASKITVVYPGNTFEFVSEKDGWFEVKLEDGKTGWIISDYAERK